MPNFEKYRTFLANNTNDVIRLSFDELKNITGFPISRAYLKKGAIYNGASRYKSYANEAGYIISDFNINERYIELTRKAQGPIQQMTSSNRDKRNPIDANNAATPANGSRPVNASRTTSGSKSKKGGSKKTKNIINFSLLRIFCWGRMDFNSAFIKYSAGFLKERNVNMPDSFLRESTSDDILEKAIDNSYRAATGQGSFNALAPKGTSKNLRPEIVKYLMDKIKTGCQGSYDEWHDRICNELISKAANKIRIAPSRPSPWTYGNSQKILNLTVKYVVLITVRLFKIKPTHPFITIGRRFLARLPELHIPADRFIVGSLMVWSSKPCGCPYVPVTRAWSAWNKADYDAFRTALNRNRINSSGILPLVWETIMWPVAEKLVLTPSNAAKISRLLQQRLGLKRRHIVTHRKVFVRRFFDHTLLSRKKPFGPHRTRNKKESHNGSQAATQVKTLRSQADKR